MPVADSNGPAVARLTPNEVAELDPEFTVRREKPEPIEKSKLNPNDEKLMARKRDPMSLYRRVLHVQDQITDWFLENQEVMGTATAEDANGNLVIEGFTTRAGVPVKLYQVGYDDQPGTSDDRFIAENRTNRRGFYQFRKLESGDYFLKFTLPRNSHHQKDGR